MTTVEHEEPLEATRFFPLHPAVTTGDREVDLVALAAARSFLRAESRAEVAAGLEAAVEALGGVVVRDGGDRHRALPVDVSLGVGEPRVVLATSPAAFARLAAALPPLVEDAWVAAAKCDRHAREAWRASVDELTGVSSRREITPRVACARPGDVVCILDLDRFKALNDATGHAAGDEALRSFGRLLIESTRAQDFVGRYGGDEFVVVMTQTRLPVAVRRLREVARECARRTDGNLTFSAGVAATDLRGGACALDAADKALYRAKRRGRARVEAAVRPFSDEVER
jgi:diguanylate cyclase (GGDEF)-like protein